jgi:hypothetical protein
MKGESLYKISTFMGNPPDICRRYYAALLPESLTDTVEFPLLHSLPTAAQLSRAQPHDAPLCITHQ